MISFWRIPWLYASTSSSFQLVSSNTSSNSAIRRSTLSPSCPYSPETNRRNSAPVSLSYTKGRSGMNPSRILAASGLTWTSSPPSSTRPCVGRRIPAIIRSVGGELVECGVYGDPLVEIDLSPGVIVEPAIEVDQSRDGPRRQPGRARECDKERRRLVAIAAGGLEHFFGAGDASRLRDGAAQRAVHPMREQLGDARRTALALDDAACLCGDPRIVTLNQRLRLEPPRQRRVARGEPIGLGVRLQRTGLHDLQCVSPVPAQAHVSPLGRIAAHAGDERGDRHDLAEARCSGGPCDAGCVAVLEVFVHDLERRTLHRESLMVCALRR